LPEAALPDAALPDAAFLECVLEDLEEAAGSPVPCPYAGLNRITAAKRPAAPSASSRAGLFSVFETVMVPM
jgi:hypothetical protein